MRHFGDPAGEYAAATTACGVHTSTDRQWWLVRGRAPAQMLNGVVTGRIPPAPAAQPEATLGARAYSTVLTPKGRMVSDLFLTRLPGADERFIVDVPETGASALRAYLAKVLPPRFATVEDVTDQAGSLAFVGPEAAAVLATVWAPDPTVGDMRAALESLAVDQALFHPDPPIVDSPPSGAALWASRVPDRGPVDAPVSCWIVTGFGAALDELRLRAEQAGAHPIGWGVWETLRVEAGLPRFGADMDERTLPPEVGIDTRAIDHTKGCYTGQEVIVRIRDRGHVNRHLRRLAFDQPVRPGTSLVAEEGGKEVGVVTSAVESPGMDGPVGLGLLRREVEVGAELPGGIRVLG